MCLLLLFTMVDKQIHWVTDSRKNRIYAHSTETADEQIQISVIPLGPFHVQKSLCCRPMPIHLFDAIWRMTDCWSLSTVGSNEIRWRIKTVEREENKIIRQTDKIERAFIFFPHILKHGQWTRITRKANQHPRKY